MCCGGQGLENLEINMMVWSLRGPLLEVLMMMQSSMVCRWLVVLQQQKSEAFYPLQPSSCHSQRTPPGGSGRRVGLIRVPIRTPNPPKPAANPRQFCHSDCIANPLALSRIESHRAISHIGHMIYHTLWNNLMRYILLFFHSILFFPPESYLLIQQQPIDMLNSSEIDGQK